MVDCELGASCLLWNPNDMLNGQFHFSLGI